MKILEHETEAEWLEQRRAGITATDIARLAHGGPATWAQVRSEKRGFGGFRGNRYTEWGKEREPFIAEYAAWLYEDLEPNNRLVESSQHPGFLATPDAIGRLVLGEFKTTVHPWKIDGNDDLQAVKPEYYDQVQWALFVCGYGETVFAWEEHENFVPVRMDHAIIARDDERIAELVEVAERFSTFLAENDSPTEFGDLVSARLALDEEIAALTDQRAAIEAEIRERAGGRDISESYQFGSLSLSWPKPRETFDSTKFKKDHPDLAAGYVKLTPPKQQTLRITGAKND